MAARVTREAKLTTGSTVVVERSALGQVAEYDVYVVTGEHRAYKGGGSKREAQRIFDKIVRDDAQTAADLDAAESRAGTR
jgi:hypothetical protein